MNLVKLFLVAAIVFTAAGCRQEQESDVKPGSPEAISVDKTGTLNVEDVWVRVAGKGRNTAMFLNILNGTEVADTLISAESDAAVLVELHETYERENDMMGMREVEYILAPSLQKVELKPRGLHVMLITLNDDLMAGDTVFAKLNFKGAGQIDITAIAVDQ